MKIIGIVIGPIYETISDSRSLKQHWYASYVFSEISKKIIQELQKKEVNFLMPIISEEELNENDNLGKYPDQIIFKSDNIDVDMLDSIIESIRKDMNFIPREYLKIEYLILNDDESSFEQLLKHMALLDNSLTNYTLTEDNFVRGKIEDEYNEKFENLMNGEKISNVTKLAEKGFYKEKYALIYYDGNSVGMELKEKYSEGIESYKNIVKNLFEFSNEIAQLLQNSKGILPLYIAGDDGFFLMPIGSDDVKLLDIIKMINENYNKKLGEFNMTLRFSVICADIQVPFKELYDDLYYGLEKAKKIFEDDKNVILIKTVEKATCKNEIGIKASKILCDNEMDILRKRFEKNFQVNDEFLPNSIYPKLSSLGYVIDEIEKLKKPERLNATLRNIFEVSDFKKIQKEVMSKNLYIDENGKNCKKLSSRIMMYGNFLKSIDDFKKGDRNV